MKKTIKILNLMMSIIILLTVILPVVNNLSEVIAASYTVKYNGKVTYGPSTVGSFTVNNKRAFCMDHEKETPPTRNSCYCGNIQR